eukprot:Filipodium_phascolosomae@DN2767_c0_g1_i15.p1
MGIRCLPPAATIFLARSSMLGSSTQKWNSPVLKGLNSGLVVSLLKEKISTPNSIRGGQVSYPEAIIPALVSKNIQIHYTNGCSCFLVYLGRLHNSVPAEYFGIEFKCFVYIRDSDTNMGERSWVLGFGSGCILAIHLVFQWIRRNHLIQTSNVK